MRSQAETFSPRKSPSAGRPASRTLQPARGTHSLADYRPAATRLVQLAATMNGRAPVALARPMPSPARPAGVVQRLVVPNAVTRAPAITLDTANLDAFKTTLQDILSWGNGGILQKIDEYIGAHGDPTSANDKAARDFATQLLQTGSWRTQLRAGTDDEQAALKARLTALRQPTHSGISGFFSKLFAPAPVPVALADHHRAAINKYWVTGNWSAMNSALRGILPPAEQAVLEAMAENGVVPPSFANRAIAVTAGLNALPAFVGSTYRRATAANGDVYGKKIKPGSIIRDRGFVATSSIKGGGGAAGGEAWGTKPGEIYVEVAGHTGRDIAPISQIQGEQEVLYPPGVYFEVDAIEVRRDTTTLVILHELAAPPAAHAVVRDPFTGDPIPP